MVVSLMETRQGPRQEHLQQRCRFSNKACFIMIVVTLLTGAVFHEINLFDEAKTLLLMTPLTMATAAARNGTGGHSSTNGSADSNIQQNQTESPSVLAVEKNPLKDVVARAGITQPLTEAELDDLWQNISSLYYSKSKGGPIILGTERCAEFRAKHGTNITLGMAGMFNTGTNAMLHNLQTNLGIPGNSENVWSQNDKAFRKLDGINLEVPWWKHNPRFLVPKDNSTYYWKNLTRDPIQHSNILPIVMVRDPLMWRHSMCKNSYCMTWKNSSRSVLDYHCPRAGIDEIRMGVPFLHRGDKHIPRLKPYTYADSLMDAWNKFYQPYVVEADFPRLIVRFEDAIFFLPKIIETIQNCTGAYSKTTEITQRAEPAKMHQNQKGISTNLLQAIQNAANLQGRLAGINSEEIEYSHRTLDPRLMDLFGYKVQ